MDNVSFDLTWEDIHTAIENYVKEKAWSVLDTAEKDLVQTSIAFYDREEKQVSVKYAGVTVKVIRT